MRGALLKSKLMKLLKNQNFNYYEKTTTKKYGNKSDIITRSSIFSVAISLNLPNIDVNNSLVLFTIDIHVNFSIFFITPDKTAIEVMPTITLNICKSSFKYALLKIVYN